MDQKVIDKVHAYMESGNYTQTDISKAMNVSRTTVHRALKMKPSQKVETQIHEARKEKEEKHDQDIVEIIKGNDMTDMLSKTIGILNDSETLQAEVKTKGINPLVNLMDKILDKRLRVVEMEYRLKMDERQNNESLEIISALSEKMEDFTSRAEINMSGVIDPASLRDTDVS